ncbi:conserved phage virion protein [Citrobacter phage CR8]|uniref:Conserved phage virion protein n=1 Tax=Citrobacter phage CR8 TaxID=1455076 RepID=W6PP67_9CAUD|nr:conserved phage virion protein [Citrobacter phage CR8]CDM21619.1 conserved phage virion protein [Citrobacter phage CR8]
MRICFSPKVQTPKPSTAVPEPAPLAEEVKGVDVGSEDSVTTNETKGRKDLTVKKEKTAVSKAMRSTGVNMG